MIKDLEGQAGIEWGLDFGLAEGEEPPKDVEDMTEAQYTLWKIAAVLQGINDDDRIEQLKQSSKDDRPSGLLLPKRSLDS